MKQFCLNCGSSSHPKLWNGECYCDNPNIVYMDICDGCGQFMAIRIDDGSLSALYCPICTAKKIKENNMLGVDFDETREEIEGLTKEIATLKKLLNAVLKDGKVQQTLERKIKRAVKGK